MNAIVALTATEVARAVPAKVTVINSSGLARRLPVAQQTSCETVSFFVARGAHLKIAREGADVVLRPHEACLVEGRSHDPVVAIGAGSPIRILVSRSRLFSLYPSAHRLLQKPFPISPGLMHLLGNYIVTIGSLSAQLHAGAQRLASQHVLELVALAIGESQNIVDGPAEQGQANARLDEIKADILQNINRPDLTLDEIARRHRISPRCLQRLFEREGSSISAYVLEQRLCAAAKLLAAPLLSERKISDIAFSSGFNDLSYFNRSFRRRFGVTPSEARANGTATLTIDRLSG